MMAKAKQTDMKMMVPRCPMCGSYSYANSVFRHVCCINPRCDIFRVDIPKDAWMYVVDVVGSHTAYQKFLHSTELNVDRNGVQAYGYTQ